MRIPLAVRLLVIWLVTLFLLDRLASPGPDASGLAALLEVVIFPIPLFVGCWFAGRSWADGMSVVQWLRGGPRCVRCLESLEGPGRDTYCRDCHYVVSVDFGNHPSPLDPPSSATVAFLRRLHRS